MKTIAKVETILEEDLEEFLNTVGIQNVVKIFHKGSGLFLIIFKSSGINFD